MENLYFPCRALRFHRAHRGTASGHTISSMAYAFHLCGRQHPRQHHQEYSIEAAKYSFAVHANGARSEPGRRADTYSTETYSKVFNSTCTTRARTMRASARALRDGHRSQRDQCGELDACRRSVRRNIRPSTPAMGDREANRCDYCGLSNALISETLLLQLASIGLCPQNFC